MLHKRKYYITSNLSILMVSAAFISACHSHPNTLGQSTCIDNMKIECWYVCLCHTLLLDQTIITSSSFYLKLVSLLLIYTAPNSFFSLCANKRKKLKEYYRKERNKSKSKRKHKYDYMIISKQEK
jgi:hypothetical protein